jgi:hypothetical protein
MIQWFQRWIILNIFLNAMLNLSFSGSHIGFQINKKIKPFYLHYTYIYPWNNLCGWFVFWEKSMDFLSHKLLIQKSYLELLMKPFIPVKITQRYIIMKPFIPVKIIQIYYNETFRTCKNNTKIYYSIKYFKEVAVCGDN